jgi:DNA-binding winged helix-turn-helix (wHTH) protein/tetratricopeptide (TPR) repeat protein
MGKPVYHFGEFRLDPLARELTRNGEPLTVAANAFLCLVYLVEHRERAVGKDELVSAVWGRVDVSDNLLAQTIARLRRALGDEQYIKTMPRVGYRWMPDTTVVDESAAIVEQAPAGADSAHDAASAAPRRSPWLRRLPWLALLLVLLAAAGYWRWSADHRKPVRLDQGTAIVLPAEVNAPEDWKWLRLALMDLLSGDLREAKVPVESTQTVLGLLGKTDTPDSARLASFMLVIHPHVALTDNVWHVRLDATTHAGGTWQAEASSDNVLNATRAANQLLLARMGWASQFGRVPTGDVKQEYLARIVAASFANAFDVERELIEKAPPALRETPEFDFVKAEFHCVQGEYEPCKQGLADLLQRLPASTQPVLRGRTLVEQYYVYFREHDYAGGEAALSEAIQLLQKQKNAGYLAFAYAQRGELETVDGKPDQAQSDFGLARVNYALAGDTAGALGVDESIAALAMRRGQFARAIPVVQRAYEQYLRLGMRRFLADPLRDLIISQRMLLQHRDELATTERYWPFEQTHLDIPDQLSRHILAYERAHALADNGRTTEASGVLEHLLADIALDTKGEPGLQVTVYILLAKLALERNDMQAAPAWINKAMTGHLLEKDNDPRDEADARFINALVLQRAGKSQELKHAVTDMQTWAASLRNQDEWIAIRLLRAQALEAWSEGQHEQALDYLKLAMSKANEFGVPELIVDVGQAYTQSLLAAGKVEEAVAVSGELSTWAQLDWRAAWAQACAYRALGQVASWERYRQTARELAGDRVLPTDASVVMY